MTSERRRILLVDPPFQFRLIAPVLIGTVLGAIAGSAPVMWSHLLTQQHGATDLMAQASPWLSGICVALVLVCLVCGQLVHSHRIAGPLLRLRRSIKRLGDGDLSVVARLREGDELQDLSDAVTDASAALRAKVSDAQLAVASLRRLAHSALAQAPENGQESRDELLEAIGRVEAALGKFRTTSPDASTLHRAAHAPERVEFIPAFLRGTKRIRRQRRLLPLNAWSTSSH